MATDYRAKVQTTQDAYNPANSGIPTDFGIGRDVYDIKVQVAPRADSGLTGIDVTLVDNGRMYGRGTTFTRRYYGIDITDAIEDIMTIADIDRMLDNPV